MRHGLNYQDNLPQMPHDSAQRDNKQPEWVEQQERHGLAESDGLYHLGCNVYDKVQDGAEPGLFRTCHLVRDSIKWFSCTRHSFNPRISTRRYIDTLSTRTTETVT